MLVYLINDSYIVYYLIEERFSKLRLQI